MAGSSRQLEIDGESLAALRFPEYLQSTIRLAPHALSAMEKSRDFLDSCLKRGDAIYGVNTGFGALATVRISDEDLPEHQLRLVRSHAAGVGGRLPDEVARGMLLLRINSFAAGYSGVRTELVQRMVHQFNAGMIPVIPEFGSVGASGDLSPLAWMALALLGEGRCVVDGQEVSSSEWLRNHQLEPLNLAAKEGIALINGTCMMTSWGLIALARLLHLWEWATALAALSFEALLALPDAFHDSVGRIRKSDAQQLAASEIRRHVDGSRLIGRAHPAGRSPQDAYSIRCTPQVLGACLEALQSAGTVLQQEANAVTDNPLVFAEEERIISAGNFHGERVALALSQMKPAAVEIANLCERRVAKMVDPATSHGLPAFLSPDAGRGSGAMIVQYAAAERVVEARQSVLPAAADSIPTSANIEDHVSMGPVDARSLWHILEQVEAVLACEAICAAQAVDLRLDEIGESMNSLGSNTRLLHGMIRTHSKRIDTDRFIGDDMSELAEMIRNQRPPGGINAASNWLDGRIRNG